METILFLTPLDTDGTLATPAREALGAALALQAALPGATLTVGLWGQSVQTAADALATCGARTFLALESPDFGVGRYASDAAAAILGAQKVETGEPLAKCIRRLQPAEAQAGKPVPPGILKVTRKKLRPQTPFCNRLG